MVQLALEVNIIVMKGVDKKMSLERIDYYRDLQPLHDKCKRLISFHVIITLSDGSTLDGIIEDVDRERIIILVGEDVMESDNENEPEQQRQFPGGGRHRRRFRRFRRRGFPLGNLAAVALLGYPYFIPPFPFFYTF
jgi:small nuclear ribonucleoprotein (snRNP)-like protein